MSKKKKQNGENADPQQASGGSSSVVPSVDAELQSSPSVSCTLGEDDSNMTPHVDGEGTSQKQNDQLAQSAGQVFDKNPQRNEVVQNVQDGQNKPNAGQVLDKRPQRKTGDGKHKAGAKPASGQQRSYKSLFTDNRDAPTKIRLEDLRKYKTADRRIKLGTDVVDDHELTVGHYLIGYVAGKFPGKGIIAKCCNSWKVPCSLKFHASDWLIFKFDKIEDRNKVIEGGPYYIYGRPLLLKTMPDCFNFTDDEIGKVPVWVQFPNLPLQLWNAGALSMIASQFGKPLYTDGLTGTKGRIDYARVLIEVDVAVEPIDSVTIELPNGTSFEQKAYYEFMPKFCRKCRAIGHLEDKCPYYKSVSADNSKNSNPNSDADGKTSIVQQQVNNHVSNPEKGRLNSATGKGDRSSSGTVNKQASNSGKTAATGDVGKSSSGTAKKDLQGNSLPAETNVLQSSDLGAKPGINSGGGSAKLCQSAPQMVVQKTGSTEQGQGSGSSKGLNCDKATEQTADNADGMNAGTDVRVGKDLQEQAETESDSRVQIEAGNHQNSAAQGSTDAGVGTANHNALASVGDSAVELQGQRQAQLQKTAGTAEPLDTGPVTNTEGLKNTISGVAEGVAEDESGFTVVKRKNKQSKSGKQQNKINQEGNVQSALQSKPKGSKAKEQKTSKLDKGKGLAPAYAS